MINLNNLKLVTSNMNKIKEYRRFGLSNLTCELGKDLKEIDADDITVVLYKSKDAGEGNIVEDTSLHIEGENCGINIRWLLNDIYKFEGKKAIWKVLLGLNHDSCIYIFEGVILGTIINKENYNQDAFGFDDYFIPDGESITLYDLEQMDEKDLFSARKLAALNLLNNQYVRKVKISDLPEWTGNYQNSI